MNRRALITNAVIILSIGLFAPVIVIGAVWALTGEPPQLITEAPPQIPPPGTLETVFVAIGDEAATTEQRYSGTVMLVIEGMLPAEGVGLRDAFYRHAREMGIPLDEPVADGSPLLVDGEPLPDMPPYNPFHVYEVRYTVGDAPRPLTFALDTRLIDAAYEGRLRVFIVQPSIDS